MPEEDEVWDDRGFPRKALQTDRLYYDMTANQYFWTPDCIGVYWYETKEEALVDIDLQGRPIIVVDKLRDY